MGHYFIYITVNNGEAIPYTCNSLKMLCDCSINEFDDFYKNLSTTFLCLSCYLVLHAPHVCMIDSWTR